MADNTTLYKFERDLDIVLGKFQMDANLPIIWLNNNEIKQFPKVSTYVWDKNIEKEMSFVGKAEKSSNTVGLLGINIDKDLNFKINAENICCETNNKLKAFFWIRSYLTLQKAKVLDDA